MRPALSRGYTELKIDTTPQAIVVSVGILSIAGLVGFLVWSGWDAAAIAGFAALALGTIASQYATTRKASQLDAKQDVQTAKIDDVLAQTHGGMHASIEAAVEQGIARGVAAARREGTP